MRHFSPLTVIAASAVISVASAQSVRSTRSATIASDVNGFALGMTVQQAGKIAPLNSIGGDQFEARKDGVQFNFGVSPLGRIYRISSEQNLGTFVVDADVLP